MGFLLSLSPYLAYFKLFNVTVAKRFREVVSWAPDKILLVNCNTGAEWTRQQERHCGTNSIAVSSVTNLLQVEDYSNQVANYFLDKGFKKGDTVALFMPSRPEYMIHW